MLENTNSFVIYLVPLYLCSSPWHFFRKSTIVLITSLQYYPSCDTHTLSIHLSRDENRYRIDRPHRL